MQQIDIANNEDLPRWLNQVLGLGSDTNWNHLEGGWIGEGYTKWQIMRIKN